MAKDGSSLTLVGRLEVDAAGFLYLPYAVVLESLAHDLPEAEAGFSPPRSHPFVSAHFSIE